MSNLHNEFVQFIQRLLDDEDMLLWFTSLSSLSDNDRTLVLRNKAVLMSQTDEDESMVKMVAGLSDNDVFNSIRAVLLAELNKKP